MGLQYNKKFFAVLITCVLLIVSSFFILGILLNSDISKTYLSEYISNKTRSEINIDDFTVNLLPVPGIKLSKARYDAAPGSVVFNSIEMILNRRELLKGKILLDEVVVRDPRLVFADSPDPVPASRPLVFSPEIKDNLF